MDRTDAEEKKKAGRLGKRPYEPPCIEDSGSFERVVLQCGRSDESIPTCDEQQGGTLTS